MFVNILIMFYFLKVKTDSTPCSPKYLKKSMNFFTYITSKFVFTHNLNFLTIVKLVTLNRLVLIFSSAGGLTFLTIL